LLLRLVEWPEFRDLLNYINIDIDTWLPVSHTTVTDWVLRQFSSMETMKSRLQSACTDILISYDLPPNCLPILGVVAQYISEDGNLETTTLALTDIQGGPYRREPLKVRARCDRRLEDSFKAQLHANGQCVK
jgi:hypothetical protein